MELQAMSDTAPIPLVLVQCGILGQCRDDLSKAVEMKFGCMAIFHNLEDSEFFGSNASKPSDPELRYYKQLSSGIKVSVLKDDLTRVKMDAVVNAANEKLNHVGGLALALSQAGGPMIQKWSDDIIKQNGKVLTGTAVVTDSGSLPCKRIIHAVGPCLSANPSRQEVDYSTPLLCDTISSILNIVHRDQITSVAIPALSSGLFNFPRNICANLIVTTIKQHNEYNAFNGRTVEINLVNNDEVTVQEMERACREILGPSCIPVSYSGAVKGTYQRASGTDQRSFPSGNSCQFGKITLHLKEGLIEEQKVNVIVNTVACDLNLSMGEISKAILEKAGKKIQEEINQQKSYYVTAGQIFVTMGHKLNCSEVYHTVCAFKSKLHAEKILYKVVFECLRKAVTAGNKSIAFPAIGTGNLGFQKHEVADIMINAVAEFARQNLSKTLDIYFVVFPKDYKMKGAFQTKFNSAKGSTMFSELPSNMTESHAIATKEPTNNETPTVELSGVHIEAVKEAKAWTVNMLNPQIPKRTIKNNYIIYFSQKDHDNLMSLQTKFNVNIQVFFRGGNGGITITGEPVSVSCAAIIVESMLCQVQESFALEEESDLLYSVVCWHCRDLSLSPKLSAALEKAYLAQKEEVVLTQGPIEDSGTTSSRQIRVNLIKRSLETNGLKSKVERACLFPNYKSFSLANNSFYVRKPAEKKKYIEISREVEFCGLNFIRMEEIENAALQQFFELNKKRVKWSTPKRLYQCVSAQFCDLICRVGFQKDFAPPAEQKYGSGIYFSSTLDSALKLWNRGEEEYIYIIQAQVLTGKSVIGSPDLILPPAMDSDPLTRYDSVSDKGNTHVIFSGQQALPEYLIICEQRNSYRRNMYV